MANAARVHAIEWGKDISARSMIAFGGAAPLHALRLAEKLDINKVIIPAGAGVGSAIGFLRAPISYEVVRSRYISLQNFDPDIVNRLMKEMSEEAREIVASGAGASELTEQRLAYMRYEGQGHEIVVPVPLRELEAEDADTLRELFEIEYSNLYGRSVPGQKPEVLSWTLSVSAPGQPPIQGLTRLIVIRPPVLWGHGSYLTLPCQISLRPLSIKEMNWVHTQKILGRQQLSKLRPLLSYRVVIPSN